jgi:hypothetical protein
MCPPQTKRRPGAPHEHLLKKQPHPPPHNPQARPPPLILDQLPFQHGLASSFLFGGNVGVVERSDVREVVVVQSWRSTFPSRREVFTTGIAVLRPPTPISSTSCFCFFDFLLLFSSTTG